MGKIWGERERRKESTYSPPCQLPSPRIASACTLVMRSKFSVSDRLADNCASWELSCA